MKKTISLQRSLFRNLAFGPILLGLMLLVTSFFATQQLIASIAAELTGRAIAETNSAFAAFLHPAKKIVDLSVRIGRAGRFVPRVPEELDTIFGPLLDAVTQISSIHLATSSGEEYMLLRTPDGQYYNRISAADNLGWITTREWRDKPTPTEKPMTKKVASQYDTRKRPWFQQALAAFEVAENRDIDDLLVWSDPYTFFTTKDPGITASIAYRNLIGSTEVLAFDILLTDILDFTKQFAFRRSGIVFVLLRRPKAGDLLVLAIPPQYGSDNAAMRPEKFPMPVSQLTGAPRTFVDAMFVKGIPEERSSLRFYSNDQRWWGAMALSPLSEKKEIWIAATIPERALLEGIPNILQITLLAILITVGIMVVRARRLARRYGDPISELVAQTERIGRLNFTRETAIESDIHEVQTLASSQDAMRRSLAALTAMNDRTAIAREHRMLPQSMQKLNAGAWEISLWDEPADIVGGCFPMMWPVRKNSKGVWILALEPSGPGAAILLVTTQLHGMQAARYAPALRATMRALLQRSADLDSILEGVQLELVHGAEVTAPISIVGAFIDGVRNTIEIVCVGRSPILHWQGLSATAEWLEVSKVDADSRTETRLIALEPADLVVIVPSTLFDILNRERQRLVPSHLEDWLADHTEKPVTEIARELGCAVRGFADATGLDDTDLTLFVIGKGQPVKQATTLSSTG